MNATIGGPWESLRGATFLFFLVGVPIGLVIGAIFLRLAIRLYDKMAGGPSSPSYVPEPGIGKAIGVTLVTSIVNGLVGFVIGLMVGFGAGYSGVGGIGPIAFAQLVSVPVSFLVFAGLLRAMLPTTLGRGILITLCYLAIWSIIAVAVAAVLGIIIIVSRVS